jgi:hypothetical protein
MRLAIDLTALGGTLSLEAGVVGITLTDAGKVEACRGFCQTMSLGARGLSMTGDGFYLPYHQR